MRTKGAYVSIALRVQRYGLPSSSGQDAGLSRRKQGFDSPRERQFPNSLGFLNFSRADTSLECASPADADQSRNAAVLSGHMVCR